ncbi:MAG: glycosyltransferase family 2 protein [Acidimicrobiales bacterium]
MTDPSSIYDPSAATDQRSPQPSLQVQTVLFGQSVNDVDRFVRGIVAAIAVARARQGLGAVTLAVGDCSAQPVLRSEDVDERRRVLRGMDIEFAYRFFNENLGSAAGNNALFDLFDSELLFIVNPDVYASPFALAELMVALATPGVGIAEARQVPLEHPKEFDRHSGDTSWASMACALVRAEVIQSISGFDSDSFFMYCDDVDFSWRTRLAGYRVVYCPSAGIYHDKRLDLAGQIEVGEAEVYYSAEASLMMAWKYSRTDLVEEWARGLLNTGSPYHQRAVETFRQRERSGTLPRQLDADGDVSQFIGYAFARHRFAYDD